MPRESPKKSRLSKALLVGGSIRARFQRFKENILVWNTSHHLRPG